MLSKESIFPVVVNSAFHFRNQNNTPLLLVVGYNNEGWYMQGIQYTQAIGTSSTKAFGVKEFQPAFRVT